MNVTVADVVGVVRGDGVNVTNGHRRARSRLDGSGPIAAGDSLMAEAESET